MPKNQQIITIVHHKVELKKVTLYLAWQDKLTQASEQFEGYIKTTLIEPGFVTPNENEYVIIFKFKNQKSLTLWQNSDIRKSILEEANDFSIETPKLRSFSGLEHWFLDAKKTPSRTKMTVISFLAIWPLVHFIPPLLLPILSFSNIANETITTAIITLGMSYVALPAMTRIFKFWLKKD